MPRGKRGKDGMPGQLLPRSSSGMQQGQKATSKKPFPTNSGLDRRVKQSQGMPAEQGVSANGAGEGLKISVDLADHLHDVAEAERAKLGPIVVQAVEAAVKAAIPACHCPGSERCVHDSDATGVKPPSPEDAVQDR